MADELQPIVQRMIDAGESEENIATVIQHFKAQEPHLDSLAEHMQKRTGLLQAPVAEGAQPSSIMQGLSHLAHPQSLDDFVGLMIPSGVAEGASAAMRLFSRAGKYIAAEPEATGPLSGLRRIIRGGWEGMHEEASPSRAPGWQPTIRGGKELSYAENPPIRYAAPATWDKAAAEKAALETSVPKPPDILHGADMHRPGVVPARPSPAQPIAPAEPVVPTRSVVLHGAEGYRPGAVRVAALNHPVKPGVAAAASGSTPSAPPAEVLQGGEAYRPGAVPPRVSPEIAGTEAAEPIVPTEPVLLTGPAQFRPGAVPPRPSAESAVRPGEAAAAAGNQPPMSLGRGPQSLSVADQALLDQIEANNARIAERGSAPKVGDTAPSGSKLITSKDKPPFEWTNPKLKLKSGEPAAGIRMTAEKPPAVEQLDTPPKPKPTLTGNMGKGAKHSTNDLREAQHYIREHPAATDEEVDAHVMVKRAERHAVKYADAQNAAKLRMKADTPPPEGTILSHTPDGDK